MPSISGIGIALPECIYSQDDVLEVGAKWLSAQPKDYELFKKFLTSSKTHSRTFVLPKSEILELKGLQQRAQIFENCAAPLGAAAMRSALSMSGTNDLSGLVFTSCSCPVIPSVDALIIDQLGLDRSITRVPVFQYGCAGGVAGLKLAFELCKNRDAVALTAVELCSLVFQKESPNAAQLVGAAIFADGAASVVITNEERGLTLRGSQSYLIPDSRHLMGYDIFDDGFHLRLDKELPRALLSVAPQRISSFLRQHGLEQDQVAYWLFHPGGTKILDFLESHLALHSEQAYWARKVLSESGNMSSATVLFVLKSFLDSKVCKSGDKVVMVGIGPGLTLELLLFEWV